MGSHLSSISIVNNLTTDVEGMIRRLPAELYTHRAYTQNGEAKHGSLDTGLDLYIHLMLTAQSECIRSGIIIHLPHIY